MAIIALQTQLGDVRVYENQTNVFTGSYSWEQLSSDTGLADNLPYSYKIKFTTSGNKVDPQIHFFNLPAQIVNLPKYLFIGFNNKSTLGSVALQVEVSELTIEVK